MSATTAPEVDDIVAKEYEHGFVTDIESDTFPPGLDASVVRAISAKKEEPKWMTELRLKALEHWQGMTEPNWANVDHPRIDYQGIS